MAYLGESFWKEFCGARGPALTHTHGEHVGDRPSEHPECPCKECGLTPERWTKMLVADPDSLPLSLEQATAVGNCNSSLHKAISSKIDGEHANWIMCPDCDVPVEPKMATGQLSGPVYGPGRGWATPRMKLRWAAIAHRAYTREGGEYAVAG